MSATLAWEAGSNPVLWEIGHGIGAFLTSPGLAALAALAVGWVTTVEVRSTRRTDITKHRESLEADRVHRRREQLWTRYIWVAEHPGSVSADVLAEVVKSIRAEAEELDDASLLAVVGAQRATELSEANERWRNYRSRREPTQGT
jgi:hypothetical protein